MQEIDSKLWAEFEKEKSGLIKKVKGRIKISKSNSNIPQGEWIAKITAVLNISELARDYNIESCPFCNYDLYFDDGRGWFICGNQKWNHRKCFSGNIVDFMKFVGGNDER